MNQATQAILVAQATADVVHKLQSLMDFDSIKNEGRVFMAAAVESLGHKWQEGRDAYDRGFPQLKQQIFEWVVKKAGTEVNEALGEAAREQGIHTARLRNLRESHADLMARLAERHRSAVPKGADDDFVRLINSSHEEMVAVAERHFADFMAIIQLKHRLMLEHCFTGHLVSEATAKKLVELYEVK